MANSKNSNSKSRSGQGSSRTGQTSNKNKGNSRATNTRSQKPVENDPGDITIAVIIAVVVALFLELSNFNILGQLGGYVKYGQFGMFGIIAYVFPIALFFFVLYLTIRKIHKAGPVVCMVIMFICACAFTHLTSGFETGKVSLLETFVLSAEGSTGGGIIGGALAIGLSLLVGRTGTYIIIIVAFIVCLIFALRIPIVELISGLFEKDEVEEEERAQERRKRREQPVERERRHAPRENTVYDETDGEGQRVNITYSSSRRASRQIRRNEAKRRKKAMPMRQASFEMRRLENRPKGVPDNIEFSSLSSNNDEMSEITRRHMVSEEPVVPEKAENIITEHNVSKEETVFGNSGSFSNDEITSKSARAGSTSREAKESNTYKSANTRPVAATKESNSIHDQISRSRVTSPQDVKPSKVSDDGYKYPPLDLLDRRKSNVSANENTNSTAEDLVKVLSTYGVNVTLEGIQKGPSVTRYELKPELGTRVNKITSLADDLKLNLAVADIRIEAPIPGRAAIGIEIPNKTKQAVLMRDLLEEQSLVNNSSKIAFAAGKDISGNVIVSDIAKMPHMLVAGTTGSGKSVFLNTILMTILYRAKPSEVGLIIIDPKMVEFRPYCGIPHLVQDVVTDPAQAVATLRWAVAEMTSRYSRMQMSGVRDFKSYNEKFKKGQTSPEEENPKIMPQIVIVIDELADLMMVASKEVEGLICRLAQLARAAGIHLIVATQRPSVDVVTGLIKANIPARVALLVATGTDSRTIIDMNGAEKLLGYGDMLFYPTGYIKPVRVQGAFVSDREVSDTIEFIKRNNNCNFYKAEAEEIENYKSGNVSGPMIPGFAGPSDDDGSSNKYDEYFFEAGKFCIEANKASSSNLQRKFNIGFNRAARIIDQLEEFGVVGPQNGSKPREIIMDLYSFEEKYGEM